MRIGLMSGGLLAVALRFSGLARHRADLAERVQKSLAQEIEARIDQQATLEQALEQVRHSETRFHGMANAVADALWDWDLRGNSLWWGEGVTKLFGHRPEDLGSSVEAWKRLIHPDDLQRVGDSLQQVWKSGGSSWTVE